MKAMKLSVSLFLESQLSINATMIPSAWNEWFWIKKPSSIAYVQDVVHIAVKLKSRLIKPSIVLPMGMYLAGGHHLHLLHTTLGKDIHGLREKDIDHKDKQNFDAVLHIICASQYHDQLPNAIATKQYIHLIESIIDAFLDEGLKPLERIQKIWYVAFFVRYWRQWIIQHKDYTLTDNFITPNAYMCIELNAHALITFLITLREGGDALYMPWVLGSQSCEKIFRSARSMTSIFSTVINFSVLGLLRRLHRLKIQSQLQAESYQSGIIYPQVKKHENKEGNKSCNEHRKKPENTDSRMSCSKHENMGEKKSCIIYSVKEISNSDIFKVITLAKTKAQTDIKNLGIDVSNLDINETFSNENLDSDSDDDCEQFEESVDSSTIVKDVCMDNPEDVKKDIESLSDIIDGDVKHKLMDMQQIRAFLQIHRKYIKIHPATTSRNILKQINQPKRPTHRSCN